MQQERSTDSRGGENFLTGDYEALDGIRGLAILFVMAAHLGFSAAGHPNVFPPGVLGVDIFLGLSGFLIASALLKDSHVAGSVRFKRFYMRRAARIMPGLIGLLTVSNVLAFFFPSLLSGASVRRATFGALSLSANIRIVSSCSYFDPLSMLWSLSLEEQFYLILPLSLFILLKLRSLFCWIVAGLLPLCISIGLRYQGCLGFIEPNTCWAMWAAHSSESRFMGQVLGVWLACLWRFGYLDFGSERTQKWAAVAVGVFMCLIVQATVVPTSTSCMLFDITCFAAMGLIIIAVSDKSSPIKTVLSMKWLTYLGKISYGLYLWHMLVNWVVGAVLHTTLLIECLVATLISILVSHFSFYIIERPVLNRVRGALRN